MSARVAPSRRLRAGLLLFAAVQLGAALAVGFVWPARVAGAPVSAAFFLLAALLLLRESGRASKTHQIDVSGTGSIRLTVQQKVETGPSASNGFVVTLLPATLVWPALLVLHLADEQGRTHIVPVLPDSLAPPDYRALRVAIGSLCRRAEQAARASEIP